VRENQFKREPLRVEGPKSGLRYLLGLPFLPQTPCIIPLRPLMALHPRPFFVGGSCPFVDSMKIVAMLFGERCARGSDFFDDGIVHGKGAINVSGVQTIGK